MHVGTSTYVCIAYGRASKHQYATAEAVALRRDALTLRVGTSADVYVAACG